MSPRFRSTGKVARARIIPPDQLSLFEEPSEQLVRVLVPGATTERFGRVWHVGRTEGDRTFLYGRLGFEGTGKADLWNDEDKDFEESRTPSGVAAPFAIRLRDLSLVFQTRGQDIRVTSFTGALQGILRDATGSQNWRVVTDRAQVTFREWRVTVDKVTQMRFAVFPPNPNYQGRPQLESLIAGASLSAADITLRAEDGINTDSEIVTELLDHVERGYGRDVAVAERSADGEVIETVYSSELSGESEVLIRPANPETGEVERDTLVTELTDFDETEHA